MLIYNSYIINQLHTTVTYESWNVVWPWMSLLPDSFSYSNTSVISSLHRNSWLISELKIHSLVITSPTETKYSTAWNQSPMNDYSPWISLCTTGNRMNISTKNMYTVCNRFNYFFSSWEYMNMLFGYNNFLNKDNFFLVSAQLLKK